MRKCGPRFVPLPAFALALSVLALVVGCAGRPNTAPNTTNAPTTHAAVAGTFGGATLPSGHELTALQQSCQICHSFDMVYTQRLSKKTWDAEVTKMIKFGSPLPKGDKAAVVGYLARYLGPTVPRSNARATAQAPAITYTAAPQQP